MALVFTVETGSGVAGANAYITEAFADQYHDDHGDSTIWDASANKELAIIEGSQFLDARYGRRWLGSRRKGHDNDDSQGLDWPRVDAVDDSGFWIKHDVVPVAVKEGTAIAALLYETEKTAGRVLMPDVAAPVGSKKKELVKVGPITIADEWTGAGDVQRFFTKLDWILRDVLQPAGRVRRG